MDDNVKYEAHRIEEFMRIAMKGEKPPIQTYNKRSRMGFPYLENKQEVLDLLCFDALSALKESYPVMNVRLQADSKDNLA